MKLSPFLLTRNCWTIFGLRFGYYFYHLMVVSPLPSRQWPSWIAQRGVLPGQGCCV
jgi:hypothetical protein